MHQLEHKTIREIASQLGETEPAPLRQIRRLIEVKGLDFVREQVQRAREVDAAGGLMTLDGTRRRTLGGVFFFLARGQLSRDEAKLVFPHNKKKVTAIPPRPLSREERAALYQNAAEEKGVARIVKITLIGRPGKVVQRDSFVMTTMRAPKKLPPLPKGLPALQEEQQPPYMVYISQKQWRKVAGAIRNPEDVLIIEGFLRYDASLNAQTVYASNTTTKLLQQAQRGAQRAQAAPSNS